MSSAATNTENVIRSDELYPLDEACRRMLWKKAALRAARRRGLKVRYTGRNGYILGKDLIAFIESEATVND